MIAVALLLFISTANALPTGAPTKVCQTMLPFHGGGIPAQLGSSPFGVTAIRTNGNVVVSVRSPIEVPFQGLMLQARLENGKLGGVFEPITQNVHTINCDQAGDTITHDNTQRKSAVEVKWTPPAGYLGSIIFNATVAQEYSTFWVGVESDSFQVDGDDHTATPESTTAAPIINDTFYNGCETTKLCFGTTEGCLAKQNCEAVVAVTVSGDRYEFELKALGSPLWVGVGLSGDDKMGDDSVLECVKEGNSIKPYLSWTTPRPNLGVGRITNPQQGIQLLQSNIIDDSIYCKVLRNSKTTINGKEFDLINTKYYLLIAAGNKLEANGDLDFHYLGQRASSADRYLSDVSSVQGASKLLLRLHGAFMLAAWIGTASLGTFIARYYRKTWVGKTICGKDLWFAWHRCFMVLTWALTTVAFVLIFVELKAWSSEDNPHAILGCIVTAICFMQPIGAFFRPHPGTPRRPVFNWLHWLGGNIAHIIAIITVFFAVNLNKAELPNFFNWIMVAYVAFHVLMHLVLSILGCVSDNSSNQRVTAFPMKDLTNSGKMSAQMVNVDAPLSGTRKLLLGFYVLIVAALTAGLIVIAVLAPIKTATVAQEYSTFWVGVESDSFKVDGDDQTAILPKVLSSTPPHFTPESTTAAPIINDPFYDGCETTKLCFGTSDGCLAKQNCEAVVAVTVSGDRYEFELKALGSPLWVGVGLSGDDKMGDDSVLECVKEGNSIKPYLSWTTPRPSLGVGRITNPQHGIQLLQSNVIDDSIYCKVLRNSKTTINGKEFDLINTKYYLLIAAGNKLEANGDLDFHYLGQRASSVDRYLSDVSSVQGASKLLLRLHGAFMLAAWIGTASLGTFIARYYRKTWVGKTICGKDLWFAWHRCFMVLTWALTTVAFVLIFVELKAWSSENNPHAILGCIVTAICFMQPIGAFFRPHPGTPRRPVFNWLHWLGGNIAHIIAIITVFFAVNLNKAELPDWFYWIMVAYVAFHVLMHLVLSILGCISDNSSNQRVTAFPMKDLTNSGKMSAQMVNVDAPLSGTRKLLLGFYVLIVAALTAGLIVIAVLAPIKT